VDTNFQNILTTSYDNLVSTDFGIETVS